ncbi:hypothetical protein B9Z55_021005 [Caenorhabditis nigoni]|uniref:GH18 domain-containing protein n=1 Tax=Caenorhabditis nigoni TaxID=1611254 RepID=A0A2G5TQQ9_9PELO|nr:hypothetical protein B9Z55_021005 [Caenorhabditis nigoni]
MLPSRMNRTPAEDPLLEKNSRLLSEKRSKIITTFLYGMIVSGILTITLSIVLLHIKGVINHQNAPITTTVVVESTIPELPTTTTEPSTTTLPTTTTTTVSTTTTTVPFTTTTEPSTVPPTTTPEPTTTSTVPLTITTEPSTVPTTTPKPTTTTVLTTTKPVINVELTSTEPFTTITIVPIETRTVLTIEEETTTTVPLTTTTVPTDTVPTTTTTVPITTTTSTEHDQKCAKRVIGYFSDSPNLEITENQLKKLTHAVLTSDFLTNSGTIEFKNNHVGNRLELLKKLSGDDTKVMISLGGDRSFSELLQTEKSRKLLAYNIVDFLVISQIDGVDLFWKWPTASDNKNYTEFVKILRKTMLAENSDLILSVTSAPAGIPGYWPVGFNLEEMINNVDFINVFSMDFYGPWGEKTGPAAPLYYGVHPRENYTVDYTMQYYVCKLKDPTKLNIVVPFDVRIWENVGDPLEPTKSEVFRKAELKSGKVQGTIWTSRRQAEEAGIKLSEASWDEATRSSYVWNQNEKWISTFEDKKSVEAKLDYINSKNLGGIWIRSVDMDDGSVNLLDSVDFGGYCTSASDNAVKYEC